MADHDCQEPHGSRAGRENCRELLGELSDYVDGSAPPSLCAEIERHLAGCDKCRVVVDTLGRTVSLYQAMPEEDVPDVVTERLLHVLKLDRDP